MTLYFRRALGHHDTYYGQHANACYEEISRMRESTPSFHVAQVFITMMRRRRFVLTPPRRFQRQPILRHRQPGGDSRPQHYYLLLRLAAYDSHAGAGDAVGRRRPSLRYRVPLQKSRAPDMMLTGDDAADARPAASFRPEMRYYVFFARSIASTRLLSSTIPLSSHGPEPYSTTIQHIHTRWWERRDADRHAATMPSRAAR